MMPLWGFLDEDAILLIWYVSIQTWWGPGVGSALAAQWNVVVDP